MPVVSVKISRFIVSALIFRDHRRRLNLSAHQRPLTARDRRGRLVQRVLARRFDSTQSADQPHVEFLGVDCVMRSTMTVRTQPDHPGRMVRPVICQPGDVMWFEVRRPVSP